MEKKRLGIIVLIVFVWIFLSFFSVNSYLGKPMFAPVSKQMLCAIGGEGCSGGGCTPAWTCLDGDTRLTTNCGYATIDCGDFEICYGGRCVSDNEKDPSFYSEKEVFLISDKNWGDVLSLVSMTTWTGKEEWCQRGYGTPEGVCVYPTMVWHEEIFPEDLPSETINLYVSVSDILVNGLEYSEWSTDLMIVLFFEPATIAIGEQANLNIQIFNLGSTPFYIDSLEISGYSSDLQVAEGYSSIISVNQNVGGGGGLFIVRFCYCF